MADPAGVDDRIADAGARSDAHVADSAGVDDRARVAEGPA
ncbi:hypothetical protein SAMN02745121_08784 [Nannocystis exedens]|uniref:Uncharacterized protein n=1 Tax=Nannocystis exedens TaxID=54 RepID=A0A1I2IJP6_9BACT|nr:hypothetical protein NAEX_05587 [Nannocystis exedens]SFF42602.1 hypothetical protein SAMN02745121_08784 [Nannocystis exedens]